MWHLVSAASACWPGNVRIWVLPLRSQMLTSVGDGDLRHNNKALVRAFSPGPLLETRTRQLPARRPAAPALLHLRGAALAAAVW